MGQAVIKILISIILVVLLAEVSKRVNPTLGGTLLGLPLGIGLSGYFIAYSQGVPFFVKSIPWGIAGLSSAVLFCFFYMLGGKIFENRSKILSIIMSTLFGFAAFLFMGYWLQKIEFTLPLSVMIFIAAFILNIIFIGKIKIKTSESKKEKKPVSLLALIVRGIMVGFIVIAITGVASIAGNKWAGVLNSFPSTMFSLVLVLHFEEGNNFFPSVIYGFSYSISALMMFYIFCWYILPTFGLNLGYVIVYLGSFLFLYIFDKAQKAITKRLVHANS